MVLVITQVLSQSYRVGGSGAQGSTYSYVMQKVTNIKEAYVSGNYSDQGKAF